MVQLSVRVHRFKTYVARSLWSRGGVPYSYCQQGSLSADRLDKAVNLINARPGVRVWKRCIPSVVEVACQVGLCIWDNLHATGKGEGGGGVFHAAGYTSSQKRCRWHPTSGRPLDRPTAAPSGPPLCDFHLGGNGRPRCSR